MDPSKISWKEGLPYSDRFDDIYFARIGGLEESVYIFLELNELQQKFSSLPEYHIAELGFGTGLNFLLAWRLFINCAAGDSVLNFTSIEKYPLSLEELKTAWKLWPELASFSAELGDSLTELKDGHNNFKLAGGRISLDIICADIREALPQIKNVPVGSWFLDGFAPRKNPEMWDDYVLDQVTALSGPDSSLATFSSAGFLRRGLQSRGWEVTKVKGWGGKAESLRAVLLPNRHFKT